MPFELESLQIWQKAFDLSDEVHQLTLIFPKSRCSVLASQIKRTSDSVVLNICEGSTGLSNAEFARSLNISLRSAIEVVGCMMMAKRRSYIAEEQYQLLYNSYDHLCRMITKFRDSLK